jgi:hypothetical protein
MMFLQSLQNLYVEGGLKLPPSIHAECHPMPALAHRDAPELDLTIFCSLPPRPCAQPNFRGVME